MSISNWHRKQVQLTVRKGWESPAHIIAIHNGDIVVRTERKRAHAVGTSSAENIS